ncbi:hypothetical protein HDU91_007020 [Kappamyces sp. JEL0680]|nr:hypothetical protein HDU91_007020 [Kappamyces sp. JEL0680]
MLAHPTPLLEAPKLARRLGVNSVHLKLDNLQPGASFKMRGLSHAMERAVAANPHLAVFVSSSGGNAGLAATIAARHLRRPILVFVPSSTSVLAQTILQDHGASVLVRGDVWDQAHAAAAAHVAQLPADRPGFLVHPFEGKDIWEGHATLVREIWDTGLVPDVIVCSVGGGGLLCGILTGLLQVGATKTIVVAVETEGAASFAAAIENNELVTIDRIDTIAKSLGARRVTQGALDLRETYGKDKVRSLVVSDRQAVDATIAFANEHRMLVEPACGASLAAVAIADSGLAALSRVVPELDPDSRVVVEVCGGFAVTLDSIRQWQLDVQQS